MDNLRIETSRLTLSPLQIADWQDLQARAGARDVARMFLSIKQPWKEAAVKDWIDEYPWMGGASCRLGIRTHDGTLIGACGYIENGDVAGIFYLLGIEYRGVGYASEASCALLKSVFARCDVPAINCGVFHDNVASIHILQKLGFSKIGKGRAKSPGRRVESDVLKYRLTRADWLALNPLIIETDRLVIRAYRDSDVAAFHRIAARREIAYMMQSIPHPFSRDAAAKWIAQRQYRGQPSFCAAICLKDGTLIGNVGIGGDPVSTLYFVDPDLWGQSYATEAMQGFLTAVLNQFGLDSVIAGAMLDNPASQAVLQKLGFTETHRKTHQPSLRLEPEPLIMYRLNSANLKATP